MRLETEDGYLRMTSGRRFIPSQAQREDEKIEIQEHTIDADNSLEDSLFVSSSDVNERGICKWYYNTSYCCRCSLLVAVAVTIALSIFIPFTFVHILPGVAQNIVNDASLSLVRSVLSDPTSTSLLLDGTFLLNNGGIFDATVHPANVTLGLTPKEDEKFVPFGWLMFPEIKISGSRTTRIDANTTLHITNNGLFSAATARLISGEDGRWRIVGKSTITLPYGLGNVSVNLSKDLNMPATKLIDVQCENVQLKGGHNDDLDITVDCAFLSTSVLELSSFGDTDFLLLGADSTSSENINWVTLGIVTLSNFGIHKGVNRFRNTAVKLSKIKSAGDLKSNEVALSLLLSNWANGVTQNIVLFGPHANKASFLNNLTRQKTSLSGVSRSLIVSGFMSAFHTVTGHNPETGKSCSLTDGSDCLHGSIIVLDNPMNVPIELKDVSIDIGGPKLNYTMEMDVVGIPGKQVICNKNGKLARIETKKGMFSWLDGGKSAKNDTIILPSSTMHSYFVPADPQPGQNTGGPCLDIKGLDPYDCCYTSAFTAAACASRSQGLTYIETTSQGNATMSVGNSTLPFEIMLQLHEENVPVLYTEDILTFKKSVVEISCEHITFQNPL
eukprot:g3875.t1